MTVDSIKCVGLYLKNISLMDSFCHYHTCITLKTKSNKLNDFNQKYPVRLKLFIPSTMIIVVLNPFT